MTDYMPAVTVEIAFDSGYTTAAGSRTWTDVSDYVELKNGISITRGRGDEMATADPNRLSLTLDNSDGRFTAGKTGGAYYPNVKIGRPIRVTSTPVGGSASVRFLGFVDEWPVDWDGTDAYASATITATSRMARLGAGTELRSMVREEFLYTTPLGYWPLGDAVGASSAQEISPTSTAALTMVGTGTSVVFGSTLVPPAEEGTAATFAGDEFTEAKYLTGTITPTTAAAGLSIECFMSTTYAANDPGTIINLTSSNARGLLTVSHFGDWMSAYYSPDDGATGLSADSPFPTIYNDGAIRHVAAHVSHVGATVTLGLYVNGVLVGSSSLGGFPAAPAFTRVIVGADPPTPYGDAQYGFNGTLSNVRVGVGPASEIADRYTAGNGFKFENASDRIKRYAKYAGMTSAEVTADVTGTPMSIISQTDSTALDMMRKVEATEEGVLFDGRDGTLTFHSRTRRFNALNAFSLSASAQQIEADYSPKLDRSTLANDVTVTNWDGAATRAYNGTSAADYGPGRVTRDYYSTTEGSATQSAWWQVNMYSEPAPRVPTLSVNLLPLDLATQTLLMAADVSTRFTVANLPAQANATNVDYFIEGYVETIGPVTYTFTFNVSPGSMGDVWTVEDPVLGQYDAYGLAL